VTRAKAVEIKQREPSAQYRCDPIDQSDSDESSLCDYFPVQHGRPVRQIDTPSLNTGNVEMPNSQSF